MINFKRIKSAILSSVVAATSIAGTFSVTAPSLNAAAATDDYAKLLQYSLYLYDANMCGSEVGEKCGITWRDDCHTDDEVQGGFHDAGDHAMFGLPQGYTASSLGWGYYEFKDAFDATGQTEHLKMITDHFCDFFKRSTKLSGDSVSKFLYQKGDGNEDHKYWGPPEKQGSGRKMFWTSGGASDIAADYAAALALNYINFGDAEDLKYAEALYKFSTQHNSVATDGPNGFYKSSGYQDEQANAAGWLYIATNNEKYKNDCASKQVEYIGWVDGWDNRGLGAACVYAHITGNWGKVNNYIGGKASGSNYLFMDKWGSARLNTTMQFCALAATKNSNADYTDWAKGQMDYITGSNPANTCFVIGFASNSAKNPHHRAASGYQSYGEFNGEAHPQAISPNGHSLVGALVGGPTDAGGSYRDDMNDYICNEVAIDYNAGFVGASAGLYHFFKSGKTVSSIEGVDKIYSGGGTTPPAGTTAPSNPGVTTTKPTTKPSPSQTTTPVGGDITLLPSDMDVDVEKGDDGEMNNYAEFSPQGAKSVTLYYTVKSNDTESSGAFGTWNGEWVQEDFKVNVKNGKVEVSYDIPSDVGQTVKAMIFWPHGDSVEIEKVVLSGASSAGTTKPTTTKPTTTKPTTTKPTTTKPTTTKPTTTKPTTTKPTTTQPQPSNPGSTTTTVTLYGDANCDGRVTIADATAILQHVGNTDKYGLSAQGLANADVSGNGDGVTAADATTIQRIDAGEIKASDLPIR